MPKSSKYGQIKSFYRLVVSFNIDTIVEMLNPSSCSSRYDTENMDTYERNNIYIKEFYIKELGMTMGQIWGASRKTWMPIQARIA